MKQELLMDAITALDGDFLDEALDTRARLLPRAKRRIKPLALKRMSAAACLLALLVVLPYAKLVFSGSHGSNTDSGPDGYYPAYYASAGDAEEALGEDLLLGRLDSCLSLREDICITYPLPEEDRTPDTPPLVLEASYLLQDTSAQVPPSAAPPQDSAPQDGPSAEGLPSYDTDKFPWIDLFPDENEEPPEEVLPEGGVRLYVVFRCSHIQDSPLGGYVEQGLIRRYGDVTVHWSITQGAAMEGHAKFLHGGHLYILDVKDADDLSVYLEQMLGKETRP